MKKFIYIAVAVILITSLMPGINYSAPAAFLEITIESPEAGQEELREAQEVISRRLLAYGVTAFETETHPQRPELTIRFREEVSAEAVLPLITSVGKLEFCEVYTQPEVFQMLNGSGREEAWKQWLPLDAPAGEMAAVLGSIAPEKITGFGHFVLSQQASGVLPANLSFAFGRFPDENGNRELYALRYGKGISPLLTGSSVKRSEAQYDEITGSASIGLTFDEDGGAHWAKATRDNMLRPVAIVFDGLVYFAPRVLAEINSGQAQITGAFSSEEAQLIAALAQGGELPVPFRVKEVKQ